MTKTAMYHVLNTKIAAIRGKMLTETDYRRLLNMTSVQEIVSYLKGHTSYRKFLQTVKLDSGDRFALEKILNEKLIALLTNLRKYVTGPYRDFLNCFQIRYEVAELKQIAKQIQQTGYASHYEKPVFLAKNPTINLEKIRSAKTIRELIENLAGTFYFSFLKNLLKSEQITLFHFEMTLDRAFFNILEENALKLRKKDQQVFYQIYGTYFDMLNIQMIYRGKKFYHRSPEEIFNYSINQGNVFNYRHIKELCYCEDLEQLREKIATTPYSFMLKGDELQDIYMERRMHRYMYYRMQRALKSYANDISSLLAILMLVDFEKRDLVSIIECVRYGLEQGKAEKYLIRELG
ncbi:MAG: V-type ATPase subunit [Caldibacillus sp.]